jgi:subtilisin family serine protease
LGDDGSANAWDVANHIVSFGEAGVDVLNLSFVCYTSDGEAPLVLANAINRLQPGTVVVAAAGNLAPDTQSPGPAWPAAFDRVIAVGASDEHGRSAPFSPQAPWVDILSPGTNVTSTFLDGPVRIGTKSTEGSRTFKGFAAWSGTSFAAARVTGTIAAGVLPGRISARESLDNLLSTLDRFAGGAVIPRVLRTR